jgi:tetratricopeptide (TPR) repeat protein
MHPRPEAVAREARAALQRNDVAAALVLLDTALAAPHAHPGLLALRGAAHARARHFDAAIADFSAALALTPDNPALLFNRALAYNACERAEDALADFVEVARIDPHAAEASANAGVLLQRLGRHHEAISHLEKARAARPADPRVLRSLGSALRGAGRGDEGLALLAESERLAPGDPAGLTDHAVALLSTGRADEARARFERALRHDPRDQTALAGLYMSANDLGDTATAALLMDYDHLLGGARIGAADGVDVDALRKAILAHSGLHWEPAGRSTRRGEQSVMLDLSAGSPFAAFAAFVDRFVAARIAAVAADPALASHPWASHAPRRWRLQSWATVLHEDGHQDPHIHPAGWLSGVVYVDAGDAAPGPEDGSLVFGHPPPATMVSAPREHVHTPRTGSLTSFPSYFFHHTRPYRGTRPRISLAFDVLPLA